MDVHVYKNKIIRDADLRHRSYDRICIYFSSVLSSNLSCSAVLEEAFFTGNGWMDCSFYGSQYRGAVMNLEQYKRCSMSCVYLEQTRLHEIRAAECGFMGGLWIHVHVRDSLFQNCSFRNLHMAGSDIENTVFQECVFDGVFLERAGMSGIVFQKCKFLGKIKGFSEGCRLQNCFIDC